MGGGNTMRIKLQRLRFVVGTAMLYALTIGFAWFVLQPPPPLAHSKTVAFKQPAKQVTAPVAAIVSGRPVRIVIPASGVDLTVDPGFYDKASNTWTLSGTHAQFDMASASANNQSGETFIYGHNNNSVFGALRHNTPAVGAQALIYTDSGQALSYRFVNADNVSPNDLSVLDYSGASRLTVQTCTGSFDEWRTLYRFEFEKVVQ